MATLIPRIPLPAEKPQLKRELSIYRDRQVWLSIAVTALAAGGVFCAFSYLAPLLTDVAGLDAGWVPTVLALFGVGALIGTTIGGRVADAHLFGVLMSGIAASTVFLVALALFASNQVAAVGLAFLLGLSAFYTAPALNARMFNVAGAAPTLAGATTTAAFNLGNTGGPWLGGTVIDADFGFAATAWAGAAMTVLALVGVVCSLRLHGGGRSRRVAGSPAAASARRRRPWKRLPRRCDPGGRVGRIRSAAGNRASLRPAQPRVRQPAHQFLASRSPRPRPAPRPRTGATVRRSGRARRRAAGSRSRRRRRAAPRTRRR